MNGDGEGGTIATLEPDSEDDGYVSPDFDLPSESNEEPLPPAKGKRNFREEPSPTKKRKVDIHDDMNEDEELALRLLRRR
jgi:ATP-dependent RNA helicase DDX10/DBP4